MRSGPPSLSLELPTSLEASQTWDVHAGRTPMYIFTSSPRATRSKRTGRAGWTYGFRRLDRSRREAHLPREDGPHGPVRIPRRNLRRLLGPAWFHPRRNRNCPDRDRTEQWTLHLRHQLPCRSHRPAENVGLLRAHRLRGGGSALSLDGLVGPGAGGARRGHEPPGGGGLGASVAPP